MHTKEILTADLASVIIVGKPFIFFTKEMTGGRPSCLGVQAIVTKENGFVIFAPVLQRVNNKIDLPITHMRMLALQMMKLCAGIATFLCLGHLANAIIVEANCSKIRGPQPRALYF